MTRDLTQGSLLKAITVFSLPYLLSYFLQTLYGLADLFIIGQYNNPDVITAVSVGSQVMHSITLVIAGFAMGSTVMISKSVGAKDAKSSSKGIGNTVLLFSAFSLILTVVFLLLTNQIIKGMSTPLKSVEQTRNYLLICFAGIPFITAYNVISAIFRGLGDTKTPMYFVAIACALNIGLDYLFIGYFDLKASGAALGTIIAQALSVIFSLIFVKYKNIGISLHKSDFKINKIIMGQILKVGLPIALQDGFIQISFIIITIIANKRGVEVAAAVGIVEKIIGLLFLIPSAMLSTVSAISAQNIGANNHERATKALKYGIIIVSSLGLFFSLLFQFISPQVVALFTSDETVIEYGTQYLKSYVFDSVFAGIHFCFSGYFCAYSISIVSFIHNFTSIILVRIPGYILATMLSPDNLFPMGLASVFGSVFSVIICVGVYMYYRKNFKKFIIKRET